MDERRSEETPSSDHLASLEAFFYYAASTDTAQKKSMVPRQASTAFLSNPVETASAQY